MFMLFNNVLQYHKISSNFELGGTRVTPKLFKNHLKQFVENGLMSFNRDEVYAMDFMRKDQNKILLTFDDAYEDVFKIAYPMMESYAFKGAIFVPVQYIGRLNDWDINFGFRFKHIGKKELKELQENGWVIGSHTLTHPDLTVIDDTKLRTELCDSKHRLEDIIGNEVYAISYPFGLYNKRVLDAVKQCGYRIGFASNNSKKGNIYAVRRTSVYIVDIYVYHMLDPLSGRLYLHRNRLFNFMARLTPLGRAVLLNKSKFSV